MSDHSKPFAQIASAAEAYLAYMAGDPDAEAITIRAAYRDLSCKQSGPECYRRVMYPGSLETVWPDSERLPPIGIRAAERRCSENCEVPLGTIVQDFERDVYRGRRGKCKRTYGIVCRSSRRPDRAMIAWVSHRVLRSRPADEADFGPLGKIGVARRD